MLAGCSGETHVEVLASNHHQARGNAWPLERDAFLQLANTGIQPGWHIVVSPISERSFALQALYDEALPAYSFVGTNFYQQDLAKKKGQADVKKALAVLDANRAGSDRTEIIAAIGSAAKRFGGDKGSSKKILVILSSGFEQSSVINMADYHLDLNEATAKHIVEHLQQLGTMPQLSGVDVCMAGITAGDHQWADQKRLVNIEHFWELFFTSAGANLVWYEPTLKGCPALPR